MKNKGFSLIEMIIVMAMMVILMAVLAPALIAYTERTRAAKDESAMGEVMNAIWLCASDWRVYDELMDMSDDENVACYIDKNSDKDYAMIPVERNEDDELVQYTFSDEARKLDETKFYAAGKMEGVTITFQPERSRRESTIQLKDAIVNKFTSDEERTLEEFPLLYNSLRLTIGNTVFLESQTYKNSEYTIFIKIGSLGGRDQSKQEAIKIYGQFSGTNLLSENITYSIALHETDKIA